ncbi:MAG: hypothetical protein QOJ64_4139 [Acidobacteriota bacterium]|jgi:hypothetical protein|nr:hypothetical protein [Acidobacteriota bacterium]
MYCLDDGTALLTDASSSPALAATLIIPEPLATTPSRPETSFPNPAVHQQQPYGYPAAPPSWMAAPGPAASTKIASPHGRGMEVTSLICAIASFVMLGFCIISGATGVSPSVIGGIFILSALLALVGAVMGIVAIVKVAKESNPQHTKVLGVVGLVINSIYLIIVIIFLVVGAIASSS